MNLKTLLLTVFIAASYVAWPNLAKPLGLRPGLVAFLVVLIALVVITITSAKDISSISQITARAFIILFVVSLANGLLAIYLCAKMAADKNVQTGTFLVSVFVLQMTFAPIADWLVNGIKPSTQQFVGLGLVVPVMWLLAQKPPQ